MDSERQKREKEIERIIRAGDSKSESDVAFQEAVRKAASAIIEEDAIRIQNTERAETSKRSISPSTAGIWLLALGAAAFVFSMPGLGGVLFFCGIAAIVWASLPQSYKPSRRQRRNVKSSSGSSPDDSC